MHKIKLSKAIAAAMLLLLLTAFFQGASATMSASFPARNRIVINDAGGALKYTSTYDQNTGHLNIHVLADSDWKAYQDVVAPFNPDCRQRLKSAFCRRIMQ